MTVCIGCGCDERHACVEGRREPCRWLEVSPSGAAGICSACATLFPPAERADTLLEAEDEIADQLDQEAEADGSVDSGLILPGDPDFDFRLGDRGRRA
jgi:hypothetical protein